MNNKEAIVILKSKGLRNCEIARLLGVSKQYVSRIVRSSEVEKGQMKLATKGGFITVGQASYLLGVSKGVVRNMDNRRLLEAIRVGNSRRKDRRFQLSEIWSVIDRDYFSKRTSDTIALPSKNGPGKMP